MTLGTSRREQAERHRTLAVFDEAAHLDVARIRFWNQNMTLVNRPDLIHTVLVEKSDDFRKGPLLTRNARPLLGQGLLTSDNTLNKRQRRIVSPGFAHRKIADYADSIVEEAEQAIDGWREGETLDIPQEMLTITLAVMGRLLFGDDVSGAAGMVGEAIPVLMNFAVDQLRDPWSAVRSVPRALRSLLALNRTLNRRLREQKNRQGGIPPHSSTNEEGALLDLLLLGGGSPMPRRLVRDEAMTLFLAGVETVALAIAWSLHLLSTHPESYNRVRAEADALGKTPAYADLPRLPYTRQVLTEAMRLYPPVYILARQAIHDVPLPDTGGDSLQRGAVVLISPYVRHRQSGIFPDPLRFDPDRWSAPDAERKLPRYAYFPFGGGPHVCIGGHFALMESHLILACLAQRIEFAAVPGQTVVPEPLFTLRPRYGLSLTAHRRS